MELFHFGNLPYSCFVVILLQIQSGKLLGGKIFPAYPLCCLYACAVVGFSEKKREDAFGENFHAIIEYRDEGNHYSFNVQGVVNDTLGSLRLIRSIIGAGTKNFLSGHYG